MKQYVIKIEPTEDYDGSRATVDLTDRIYYVSRIGDDPHSGGRRIYITEDYTEAKIFTRDLIFKYVTNVTKRHYDSGEPVIVSQELPTIISNIKNLSQI